MIMKDELILAAKEIFGFKEMLKDVVFASMNTPDETLDKIFPIFEQIVEMVEEIHFNLTDFKDFVSNELIKYDAQPFFPVLGGLYINALINKLFQYTDHFTLDLNELCFKIIDEATKEATSYDQDKEKGVVSFSLDFIGYLLHPFKKLIIVGPVGDFCGALMGEHSIIKLKGMHGKHLGYEKHESAKIIVKK